MKLSDDINKDTKRTLPLIYMELAATIFVVCILAITLLINSESIQKKVNGLKNMNQAVEETETGTDENAQLLTQMDQSVDELVSGSTLTSDELSFWNDEEETATQDADTQDDEAVGTVTEEVLEEVDPSTDGNHTLIVYENGEEEWVAINSYLNLHKYDFSGLVYEDPFMKYFENSAKLSYAGVSISKEEGYVDFNKLKKAGIQYVMIRLGQRGYGSGQVSLDENYSDNMKRANDASLDLGVYFYSQAITEAEAVEEANFVIEHLKEYKITFPVAFVMEKIVGDSSRIENLTVNERTKIAASFLSTIEAAGYNGVLYGNKEWMLKQLDLTKLKDYDTWLSQNSDIPDYPYQFTMWEYTKTNNVDGIAGNANLSISFIDYGIK